jgi:hypothetical protein
VLQVSEYLSLKHLLETKFVTVIILLIFDIDCHHIQHLLESLAYRILDASYVLIGRLFVCSKSNTGWGIEP